MKIIYETDDGKRFATAEECIEYEKAQGKKIMLNEIHAFDESEMKIEINNESKDYEIGDMLCKAKYVKFDSDEARCYFDDLQKEYGYSLICDCTQCLYRDDVYVWNDDIDMWESAKEMIGHYESILGRFKERK